MFCSSLRNRADLNALVPELITSIHPKLKESRLVGFDLALEFSSKVSEPITTLRLLILTPASVDKSIRASTMTRIEGFIALTGGENVAIAFLIPQSCEGFAAIAGHHAYLTLQLLLLNRPYIPLPVIIEFTGIDQFLPAMSCYISARKLYRDVASPEGSNRRALLPYATSLAHVQPLSEHDTNVLDDICHSVADVADLSETEQGKATLRDWLGAAGSGVADFWEEEREI